MKKFIFLLLASTLALSPLQAAKDAPIQVKRRGELRNKRRKRHHSNKKWLIVVGGTIFATLVIGCGLYYAGFSISGNKSRRGNNSISNPIKKASNDSTSVYQESYRVNWKDTNLSKLKPDAFEAFLNGEGKNENISILDVDRTLIVFRREMTIINQDLINDLVAFFGGKTEVMEIKGKRFPQELHLSIRNVKGRVKEKRGSKAADLVKRLENEIFKLFKINTGLIDALYGKGKIRN